MGSMQIKVRVFFSLITIVISLLALFINICGYSHDKGNIYKSLFPTSFLCVIWFVLVYTFRLFSKIDFFLVIQVCIFQKISVKLPQYIIQLLNVRLLCVVQSVDFYCGIYAYVTKLFEFREFILRLLYFQCTQCYNIINNLCLMMRRRSKFYVQNVLFITFTYFPICQQIHLNTCSSYYTVQFSTLCMFCNWFLGINQKKRKILFFFDNLFLA
eukprot:TRINITY_DN9517_c0_g1_i3.p2 TRINITY_DN9517_c0_g1~~TRINITY_DN9517_c0_g1_i3.p2  ORF type:complete len:213 (-),score=-21.12 TRINITY_DN9517_c0_g1_i3:51-689(-)